MTLTATPGNEEFAEVVNKDAKGKSDDPALTNWLRDDSILEPWHRQLVMLLNHVQSQLSHHRAERSKKIQEGFSTLEEQNNYFAQANVWRAKTLWFKKNLEDRIIEVKFLKDQYYYNNSAEEVVYLEPMQRTENTYSTIAS